MVLNNVISCQYGPAVPQSLIGCLEFRTTCEIREEEAKLTTYCINCLAKQLQYDGIDVKELLRVTAIFSPDGGFALSMPQSVSGAQFCLIAYPIQRWRDANYDKEQIATCILEELCHHFWAIKDELAVKHKVVEIFQRWMDSKFTFSQLYPGVAPYQE